MPLLSLLVLCTSCWAGDPAPVDTAQQVAVQVDEVAERVDDLGSKLSAIERYLADEILVKEGKAPKDWVQPPIEDYMKPGAPVSMIPVPPKPPTVAVRVPYGPQP